MFIIKFNNMIHNKWVWGIFATVVAVAFAASDISCGQRNQGVGAGTLGGEQVSAEDYRIMRNAVLLENDKNDKAVVNTERETWERLAALKVARQLGIKVADQELAGYIHSDSSFQEKDGTFSKALYRAVLNNIGMQTVQYEEMLRQRIMLGRLEQLVTSSSWISPATLAEKTRGYTDSFTLCTAVVSNQFDSSKMDIKDADVKAFYDNHQEQYREPDKRQVVFTVFRANDFKNEVTVQEDEIADFYDSNISRFVTKGTNGVETTKPLQEVRAKIEEELIADAAKLAAFRAAGVFSDIFYTNRNETLTFEAAAASQGLSVLTSRLFSATSSPVNVEGSPAFVEAAFALDPESPINRFSEAVNGGAESYVMGFLTNVASHIVPLESISERVRAEAKLEAADSAFRSHLDTVVESLMLGMESNKNFRAVSLAQKLVVSTNFVFSFMAAHNGSSVPAATQVANAMAAMDEGEVCPVPLFIPGGAMFFQVVKREPGEKVVYDSIKRQAFNALFSDSAGLNWKEWKQRNLATMNPSATIPSDESLATSEAETDE